MEIHTSGILTFIIRGHLYIESSIVRLINKMPKSPNYLNVSRCDYKLKVSLGCALGVIPVELEPSLRQLGKIKNKFAHDLNYTLTIEDQNDIINCLKSKLGEPARYFFNTNDKEFPNGMRRAIQAIWIYLEIYAASKNGNAYSIVNNIISVGSNLTGGYEQDFRKQMEERLESWKKGIE